MKTIGVLGGMGPMATVNLTQAIVENTLADTDQQHPPVIVDSNTRIADRTAFLLGLSTADPRPEMLRAAARLDKSGVTCIVMPCNTAHAFYDELAASTKAEVLHMIEETAHWIGENYPEQKTIGVLATQGTYSAHVYRSGLEKYGLRQVVPDTEGQRKVTGLIYDGIKANRFDYDLTGYRNAIARMKDEQGIDVIILGCTELSVAHRLHRIEGIFVDPLQIVARAAIKRVGGRVTCQTNPIKGEVA